ncbi:MAG: TlpA family protein disulfide reductase [Clostridia bacterium]|nr:TlpA family protein disulfide reductase [Clostridia bacterium]
MSNKIKFLIALIIFAVIMGTVAIIITQHLNSENSDSASSDTTDTTTDEQKDMAPDFEMTDKDGNKIKLSDMRGKPVVLNFWASWCGPCKSEMPDFEEAYKEYGDDITFMIVNLTDGKNETVDTAQNFIDSQGYTFPVYFDTDSKGAAAYGVSSIPVTYFIDAQGYLVAYGRGALNSETLKSGIDMLIN